MKDTTVTYPPLVHDRHAAAKRLGDLPVRQVDVLLAAGELKSFKIGKHRLIPEQEIVALVDRKMVEAQKPPQRRAAKKPIGRVSTDISDAGKEAA